MKVKVIKEAYYNDEFLKVGRIIDFKGKADKLPSWATLPDGIELKKDTDENKLDANKNENNTPETVNNQQVQTEENNEQKEQAAENDASPEAIAYLELLKNEGIDKDILIEDADKKTVNEQIKELEIALGRVK